MWCAGLKCRIPLDARGISAYSWGMNWKLHLTEQERTRINVIPGQRKALTAEYQRIRDRCKKRAKARAMQEKTHD